MKDREIVTSLNKKGKALNMKAFNMLQLLIIKLKLTVVACFLSYWATH